MIGKTPIRGFQMINGYALENIVAWAPRMDSSIVSPVLPILAFTFFNKCRGRVPGQGLLEIASFSPYGGSGEVVYYF